MIVNKAVLTYSDLLSSSHVETQISQDQVTYYKIAIENAGEHDGLTVRKSKMLAICSMLVLQRFPLLLLSINTLNRAKGPSTWPPSSPSGWYLNHTFAKIISPYLGHCGGGSIRCPIRGYEDRYDSEFSTGCSTCSSSPTSAVSPGLDGVCAYSS